MVDFVSRVCGTSITPENRDPPPTAVNRRRLGCRALSSLSSAAKRWAGARRRASRNANSNIRVPTACGLGAGVDTDGAGEGVEDEVDVAEGDGVRANRDVDDIAGL